MLILAKKTPNEKWKDRLYGVSLNKTGLTSEGELI
jgi:hypothetical protein